MIYEVTLADKVYRVELTQGGERWKCMLDRPRTAGWT